MSKLERRSSTNSSMVGSRFKSGEDTVPVELKFSTETGRVKAVVALRDAIRIQGLEQVVSELEGEYHRRLPLWRQMIERLVGPGEGHTMRWQLADDVTRFSEWARTERLNLVNYREALAREFSVSETWITYLLRLRERYISPSLLDEKIPWTRYHELLRFADVSKMKHCETLVRKGVVNSDSEIRRIRKIANHAK